MSGSAIIGALLIDGNGTNPLPETTVLWQGDRITWVGPDVEADVAGAEVIEAGVALCPPGSSTATFTGASTPRSKGSRRSPKSR